MFEIDEIPNLHHPLIYFIRGLLLTIGGYIADLARCRKIFRILFERRAFDVDWLCETYTRSWTSRSGRRYKTLEVLFSNLPRVSLARQSLKVDPR